MLNVVLTIHLILAVLLTGVVLLQRSEGGGLGVGGGSGVMTGRQAASTMTRLTWIFGIALFVTSISLTVIAARQSSTSSIMDRIGGAPVEQTDSNLPQLPTYTPPPGTAGDPLTPPAPASDAGDQPTAATPVTGTAPASDAPATGTAPAEPAVPPAAEVTPPATATPADETSTPAPAQTQAPAPAPAN